MYRQPSTTLQNSRKRAGQTPESISQEVIYHETLARTSSRYQVFESCSRNQAQMLLKCHFVNKCHSQYNNKVIRLLQCSYTNGGDFGCTVLDQETIIVLVLHTFNFIPQRSHHSQPCQGHGSGTAIATLTPGDGTTAIKVESSA